MMSLEKQKKSNKILKVTVKIILGMVSLLVLINLLITPGQGSLVYYHINSCKDGCGGMEPGISYNWGKVIQSPGDITKRTSVYWSSKVLEGPIPPGYLKVESIWTGDDGIIIEDSKVLFWIPFI